MNFDILKSIEVLSRTPDVLEKLLSGLSDEWLYTNEGGESWSPYDIAGHLVHGEKTDWPERTQIILYAEDKHFRPFDRTAMFEESKGKSINDLLSEFRTLRLKNIEELKSYKLDDDKLNLKGIHPSFGDVTLSQLLSTWVVHDLSHIAQISRVMAKQYKEAAGPWIEYIPILTR